MKQIYLRNQHWNFQFWLLLFSFLSFAGTVVGQTVRLEQALNGGVGLPAVSPVTWATGNATESNSHYEEGQSIPYRMVISNLTVGDHTVVIGWDNRSSSKSAIDYITGFQRIQETVDPLSGLTGSFGIPQLIVIPAPSRNTLATGFYGKQDMPGYSFGKLTSTEKNLAVYNATFSGTPTTTEGDPSATSAETRITIKFNVASKGKTVVLAWGGHIASRVDWGGGNSSGGASGTPHRTRLISLDGKGGNQERVATAFFKPSCEINGPDKSCLDITNYTANTNAPNPIFSWTVDGGNIESGAGTGSITVKWNNSTPGKVSVTIVDQSGGIISKSSTCSKDVKIDCSKSNASIGGDLSALYNDLINGKETKPNENYQFIGETVLLEVAPQPGKFNDALQFLIGLGLTFDTAPNEDDFFIAGFLPIRKLPDLNANKVLIKFARPAYKAVSNNSASGGIVRTLGDEAMRSNLARLGYENLSGSGIKVGVLSDSYDNKGGAPGDIINGDLPAVNVLKDFPTKYGTRTDEGRAMLQIVHDVAPGAELFFRTGFITSGDFARGIGEMQQAGCQIIVDDITYYTEPFFRDGKLSKAVAQVTEQGVSYFTAAGNFGAKAFEDTFRPAGAPAGLEGIAHDFGGGDRFQKISFGKGSYTIVLQWDNDFVSLGPDGAANDLDIYLTTDQGATRTGFNRNNIGGDPIEVLSFNSNTDSNTADLMVIGDPGAAGIRFKYIIFRGDGLKLEEYFNPQVSSIFGQQNSEDAMTVGAVLYSNTPAWNYSFPDGAEKFTVMSFSSRGGSVTNGVTRQKPDFTGPNGGNTTVNFGSENFDLPDFPRGGTGDRFPNFFGTSAAAPHVAAAGALIMEAWKRYKPASNPLSPNNLRELLSSTAKDMHEVGFDFKSGFGLVRTDKAIQTFAAPKPEFEKLILPDNFSSLSATQSTTVIIAGTNFTKDSKFMLRDQTIPAVFDEETGNLTVVVPPFTGNPPLKIINDPLVPGGEDGGTTEFLFSNKPKSRIIIKASDKSKAYGASLPEFTAEVLVEVNGTLTAGVLTLKDVGLTMGTPSIDELGRTLQPLNISTPADEFSDVLEIGYKIEAVHRVEDIDIAFRELYDYDTEYYQNGILRVHPIPLLITPDNLKVTYGEVFANQIAISYTFPGIDEPQYVGISEESLNKIKEDLIADHSAKLVDGTVALMDIRGRAGDGVPEFKEEFLKNLSTMASAGALGNTSTLTGNGASMEVIDFDRISFYNFLFGEGSTITADGTFPFIPPAIINTTRSGVFSAKAGVFSTKAGVFSTKAGVFSSRAGVFSVKAGVFSTKAGVFSTKAGVFSIDNQKSVGEDLVYKAGNSSYMAIVDELDFDMDKVEIIDGEEFLPIPEISPVNMVTGLHAGTHYIIPGTYLSKNFIVNYGLGKLTIEKAELSSEAEDKSQVYGDNTAFTANISGFKYQDTAETVVETTTFQLEKADDSSLVPIDGKINAGTYTIKPVTTLKSTQYIPGEPSNYTVTPKTGVLTVTPRPLTITADEGQTKVYGNLNPDYTFLAGNLVNNDTPTGALSRATGENVGKYAITLGNLTYGPNYSETFVGKDFEITPLPVTVTADAKSKTYGDNDPGLTFVSSPAVGMALPNGEAISFSGALIRTPGETVGSYSINQNSLDNSNYSISYTGAELTINKLPVTVTADAKSKTYGDIDPGLTFVSSPAVGTVLRNGEVISFKGNLKRTIGENVGKYPIENNSVDNSNYSISYIPADLTINKLPVTVTADAKSKTYGDIDPGLTFVSSPAVGTALPIGEVISFSGALNRTTGETVGPYSINQNSLDNSNYSVSYTGAVLTINKRPVTITADGKEKVYGDKDPSLTYKITSGNLVYGDGFSGSLTRSSGENAGSYAINQGTLGLSTNYSLNYISSNLIINPAPLTVKANDASIYSGQLPVYSSTITGFVNGDTRAAVVSGEPLYTVSGNISQAGTYIITPSALPLYQPSNYVVGSYINGTLSVNPSTFTAIRPTLRCVEPTNLPDYKYRARFEYINSNAITIYIPQGPDNKITITAPGSFKPETNHPTSFLAGTHPFDVLFTGEKIVWTVISTDKTKKTSSATEASLNSTRCKKGSGREAADIPVSLQPTEEFKIYPNPATDFIRIAMPESTLMQEVTAEDFRIFDQTGRNRELPFRILHEQQMVEMDLHDLAPGMYLISIRQNEGFHTLKVIKTQ